MKMQEEISPRDREQQIIVTGKEEVLKIQGAVIIKNQAHIADYAKLAITIQMIDDM